MAAHSWIQFNKGHSSQLTAPVTSVKLTFINTQMENKMKMIKLTLFLFIPVISACGPPSYKACEKEHWRIVEICRSWAGGSASNARFNNCLSDQTYDNKKYDACKNEGHIIQGFFGPKPSQN